MKRIGFIILALLSSTVQGVDRQKITFACYLDPNTNFYTKWGELVYTDALSRLNIDFSCSIMPAIRASRMVDLGKIDGEMSRVSTYGAKHPNLIRIEEPLVIDKLSAFVSNPSISIQSWKDLQNSQYNIEYYRGMALAHQRLTQYINPDRLSNSSSPEQSLRKLLRGRIDIYIDSNMNLFNLLMTPEFTDSNIKMIAILEESTTYGYLHQHHRELAVKLAVVFRQMKAEGLFDAYYQQAKEFVDSQAIPTNIVD
ncbi:hypothetical protein HQQ94_03510 [Shewanella sp. VB17]|uniref:hypothetical protein n=1 Tax=Shewanella sp. VB17 TaxID=2739432 RepID=UPI001563820E|nr:hypothetical protein [Shewanella sp. VB17]NRD72323.1 hypothetical protein [Shewanella sp. VB17]